MSGEGKTYPSKIQTLIMHKIDPEVHDQFDPEVYQNLVLDGEQIPTLDANDKQFLNKFSNLKKLQMINTGLTSLDNLPDCKLEKLYLNDNSLNGEEVKKLSKYGDDLISLRLVQNKISTIAEVEALLVACPKLQKLDLTNNKVCDDAQKEKDLINAILLSGKYNTLEILNTKDKNGEMIEESYSMDEEGEEEGELDMLDNMGLNLDPELRQKLENGELSMEDLKQLGIMQGQDDDDEYGDLLDEEQGEFEQEEGELELDEDGLNTLGKRKHGGNDEHPSGNKKQKDDHCCDGC